MSIKNYLQFINEAEAPVPPAQPAAQPPAQPAAQPPAQPAQSGTTQGEQPPAQEPAPQGQGEQKSGDLSNYVNEEATKFPDTVKKMVDLIKDMDKEQLIKLRSLIAELKSINDAKSEIGKL
jgi:hypothetical protein